MFTVDAEWNLAYQQLVLSGRFGLVVQSHSSLCSFAPRPKRLRNDRAFDMHLIWTSTYLFLCWLY